MTELQSLLKAITTDLGDPAAWPAPVEFRDSLALCALNSAYSLRATSAAASRVLTRYRELRPTADTDNGPDLLRAMNQAGGPEAFARDVLRNHSKLPGTTRLRTSGIHEALTRLAAPAIAVTTAAQLRNAANNAAAQNAWRSVAGFGPLSWSYLLMNAGVDTQTKADVMVQRYLTRALGVDGPLTSAHARQHLLAAATELNVHPRSLDRAIWMHESPSRGRVGCAK